MKLKAALKYQKMGFSVIPVKPDKKPYLMTWAEYQKIKPTENAIKKWWTTWPDANPAIVTGEISNLMVVDVDSDRGHEDLNKLMPETLTTPTATTPGGGWHYYFAYQNGLPNKARVFSDCDIRTDGGYIIAPPSIGENGKTYAWLDGLSIAEASPAAMPELLYKKMHSSTRGDFKDCKNAPDFKRLQVTSGDFKEGERDQALFHLANCLVKGGMVDANILKYMLFFASNCNPPFPEKEVLEKISSAKKRNSKVDFNIAEEVRDFIVTSSGFFLTSDVAKRLQVTSRSEKKAIVNELLRLRNSGMIERHGNKNGCYRKVENEVEEMDFLSAETESVNLWLPFGIQDMVEIMPGNIILLAGEPNAGKTGFLLNMIRENMRKFKIHYFNSEMGSSELKKRLNNFDDIALSDWKFKAWERSDNFADVIKPGKNNINIIDFLEIHEHFYEIGGLIAGIHKKLKGAVAIIALQKNPGVDTGLGGFRSIEKPRLALAMSPGVLKIVKAKNWKTSENPNGKQIRFKIASGCKLFKQGDWHKPIKETRNER
jgi:bifunctional DNA primase/polymerase-like protein/primase-like protein